MIYDKKGKPSFPFVPLISALLWSSVLFLLGKQLDFNAVSVYIFPVLLICMTAGSVIFSSRSERRLHGTSFDEIEAMMHEEKLFAETDYQAFCRDVRSDITFYHVWTFASLLFASCAVFRCGEGRLTVFKGLVTLLSVYYLWGLFCYLLPGHDSGNPRSTNILPREEYRGLYAALDETFQGSHLKLQIMCPGGSSLESDLRFGRLSVSVGAFQYSVLTDDELKALFLHDRYFVEDSRRSPFPEAKRLSSKQPAAAFFPPLIAADALMQYPFIRIHRNYALAEVAGASARERLALNYIKCSGAAGSYVTGLAKLRMLSLFDTMEPQNHVLFYEPETIMHDAVSREFDGFCRVFEQRKHLWLSLIRNELPGWGGVTLSYAQTCAELGQPCPEVIHLAVCDAERLRLLQNADRVVYEASLPTYGDDRKHFYLDPKSVLDRFRSDISNGKEYDVLEMRPVLDACCALNESDLLIHLCDECIARAETSSQTAHARFLLGRELLYRYDKTGIDEIISAMDMNENYIREGGELVETYCSLYSLRTESDAYMKRVKEITQLASERNTLIPQELSSSDRLSAEDSLPAKVADENIERIRHICGHWLLAIWALRRQLSENYYSTVYIVEFGIDTPEEEKRAFMERIYHYLDSLPQQYSLCEKQELYDVDPDLFPGAKKWSKE